MALLHARDARAPLDIFIASRDNKLHLREKDDVVSQMAATTLMETPVIMRLVTTRIGFSPEIKSQSSARNSPPPSPVLPLLIRHVKSADCYLGILV